MTADPAARLAELAHNLAKILPPTDRWICSALLRRSKDSSRSLDELLGLARNNGRRGKSGRIPERDRRLRALASKIAGPTCRKAAALLERLESGNRQLLAIDKICPIPRSHRQLVRILK